MINRDNTSLGDGLCSSLPKESSEGTEEVVLHTKG